MKQLVLIAVGAFWMVVLAGMAHYAYLTLLAWGVVHP